MVVVEDINQEKTKNMTTNAQPVYGAFAELKDHAFYPADDQPQIPSHLDDPCTKTWAGYFMFDPGTERGDMTIEVGADDNAYLTLAQFPDTPVNVNPNPSDPNGGGTYRTTSHTFEDVEAGYYFVNITYVNVGGVRENLSQLTVKVNGADMVIGELAQIAVAVNPMKEEDARAFMSEYMKLCYPHNGNEGKTNEQVYKAVGGTIGPKFGEKDFTDSCALRVTHSLVTYSTIELPVEPNKEKPDSPLKYVNLNGKQVYIRAVSVIDYMNVMLGVPDFRSYADFSVYLEALTAEERQHKPVVIWGKTSGRAHVGMGYEGEGGNIKNAEYIWLLYGPDRSTPPASVFPPAGAQEV